MSKVKIIYWSGTGNTQKMAFALGCPSMGTEELEETEMEPFMEELESGISGKKIALFGSYGWGSGEWMRDWEGRIQAAGAAVVNEEGVIANGEPSEDVVSELKALGRALV